MVLPVGSSLVASASHVLQCLVEPLDYSVSLVVFGGGCPHVRARLLKDFGVERGDEVATSVGYDSPRDSVPGYDVFMVEVHEFGSGGFSVGRHRFHPP